MIMSNESVIMLVKEAIMSHICSGKVDNDKCDKWRTVIEKVEKALNIETFDKKEDVRHTHSKVQVVAVNTIGDRMDQILKDHNMTTKDTASELGVELVQIENYITNSSSPNASFIITFCTYFSVSSDWLLGLSSADGPYIS